MSEPTLEAGDMVVPADRHNKPLRDGSAVYDLAVVVSPDPLVLVSTNGKMMWTTLRREDVVLLSRFKDLSPEGLVLSITARRESLNRRKAGDGLSCGRQTSRPTRNQ